jgi:hypothetical protein
MMFCFKKLVLNLTILCGAVTNSLFWPPDKRLAPADYLFLLNLPHSSTATGFETM